MENQSNSTPCTEGTSLACDSFRAPERDKSSREPWIPPCKCTTSKGWVGEKNREKEMVHAPQRCSETTRDASNTSKWNPTIHTCSGPLQKMDLCDNTTQEKTCQKSKEPANPIPTSYSVLHQEKRSPWQSIPCAHMRWPWPVIHRTCKSWTVGR